MFSEFSCEKRENASFLLELLLLFRMLSGVSLRFQVNSGNLSRCVSPLTERIELPRTDLNLSKLPSSNLSLTNGWNGGLVTWSFFQLIWAKKGWPTIPSQVMRDFASVKKLVTALLAFGERTGLSGNLRYDFHFRIRLAVSCSLLISFWLVSLII